MRRQMDYIVLGQDVTRSRTFEQGMWQLILRNKLNYVVSGEEFCYILCWELRRLADCLKHGG
jgi:hypothetical protein